MAAAETAGRVRGSIAGILHRLDRFVGAVAYYPLFLAAYVVLQAYQNNLGTVAAWDALITLLVVLAVTTASFALVRLLYRDTRRAAVPVAFAVVWILGYGYVREALAAYWSGDVLLLLVGSALVILVAIAANRVTRVSPITQAMSIASSLLLVVALVPIVAFAGAAIRTPSGVASSILPPVTSIAPLDPGADSPSRDIYHIVLDRYGSEQALAVRHGLDNTEFIDWLRRQGFQVVDDARATYVRSLPSIASVLSMSLLDPVVDELGPHSGDYGPILEFVRRSRAAAALQDQGYQYVHIGSWFLGTRHSEIADQGFVSDTPTTFSSAVLSYSAAGLAAEALGLSQTPEEIHAAAALYQFDVLRSLRDQPGPKLVFAHVLLPHAPYVFKEDGALDPATASYGSQLAYTNTELRRFIEPLLGLPEDERPIIILQADEGPYPERYAADPGGLDWATATEDEVVSKFGILNAMYLPGPEGAAPLPPTLSSVNTYREILTRYFDADLPNLPDRSYASPEAHPYDLTDVTDRFPGPA